MKKSKRIHHEGKKIWYWRWRDGRKVKSYQDLNRDRKIKAKHKRKRGQPTWMGDLPHSRI
jgi:hypothetical protein